MSSKKKSVDYGEKFKVYLTCQVSNNRKEHKDHITILTYGEQNKSEKKEFKYDPNDEKNPWEESAKYNSNMARHQSSKVQWSDRLGRQDDICLDAADVYARWDDDLLNTFDTRKVLKELSKTNKDVKAVFDLVNQTIANRKNT